MAALTTSQITDETAIQQEAASLLTDYANADSDVRLAIPPTVPATLSEIQTAATSHDPLLTPSIAAVKQTLTTLQSDVGNASQANDPNDPSVTKLRTDTQGLLNQWAAIKNAPPPPALDLNPFPTGPTTPPSASPPPAPSPSPQPFVDTSRTITSNIVGDPQNNPNYPKDNRSLLQAMAGLFSSEVKDSAQTFDTAIFDTIATGAANQFDYTKAQTLYDALSAAVDALIHYTSEQGLVTADKLKADRDLVTQAIATVQTDYGAPPTSTPGGGGLRPPLHFPGNPSNPGDSPVPGANPPTPGTNPPTTGTNPPDTNPPTTGTNPPTPGTNPPGTTPPPDTFPATEPDAPPVSMPGDPNFIGPLLPKTSPTPGSAGDYGQDTVYWPNDGNPTHLDELGNPLPYGVTRSLGNGTTLPTAATTSDLDPTLKEDLPTIAKAFQEWEKENGLPETTLTINAGTNGIHGKTGLSQHYVGGAIDVQLNLGKDASGKSVPLTPDQYNSLADTMHTYLPGYRVGLNQGTAKNPIAVGTADFLDPGSPTHLHLDIKNLSPLDDIQNTGTMHVIPAHAVPDLNVPEFIPSPVAALAAPIAAAAFQTPPLTFISYNVNVSTPGDNLIAAVDRMHTQPTTAANELSTIFTNALLVDHAAFFESAAIIDSAFPQLAAGITSAQVAPLFAANGPVAGFKAQYDAEVATGATPGHALADLLKTLIG